MPVAYSIVYITSIQGAQGAAGFLPFTVSIEESTGLITGNFGFGCALYLHTHHIHYAIFMYAHLYIA